MRNVTLYQTQNTQYKAVDLDGTQIMYSRSLSANRPQWNGPFMMRYIEYDTSTCRARMTFANNTINGTYAGQTIVTSMVSERSVLSPADEVRIDEACERRILGLPSVPQITNRRYGIDLIPTDGSDENEYE